MSPRFRCWTAITIVRGLRMAVQLAANFLITPPLSGLHLPANALVYELTVLEGSMRGLTVRAERQACGQECLPMRGAEKVAARS